MSLFSPSPWRYDAYLQEHWAEPGHGIERVEMKKMPTGWWVLTGPRPSDRQTIISGTASMQAYANARDAEEFMRKAAKRLEEDEYTRFVNLTLALKDLVALGAASRRSVMLQKHREVHERYETRKAKLAALSSTVLKVYDYLDLDVFLERANDTGANVRKRITDELNARANAAAQFRLTRSAPSATTAPSTKEAPMAKVISVGDVYTDGHGRKVTIVSTTGTTIAMNGSGYPVIGLVTLDGRQFTETYRLDGGSMEQPSKNDLVLTKAYTAWFAWFAATGPRIAGGVFPSEESAADYGARMSFVGGEFLGVTSTELVY